MPGGQLCGKWGEVEEGRWGLRTAGGDLGVSAPADMKPVLCSGRYCSGLQRP